MSRDVSNTADVIDSRDVIARIEELEENEERTEHEAIELVDLRKLATYGESYIDDWEYGAQLVRESYFEQHARELATDCGDMPKADRWPLYCIDWAYAARELKHDYTAFDYDGVTYYSR